MIQLLARMRDVTDAHNIAPIVAHFHTQGIPCAIACDTTGKAFDIIQTSFPELSNITKQYADPDSLIKDIPHTSVFLSSMQRDTISRTPLAHYKKRGAWTAVFQETPGWRLTDWLPEQLPDAVFAMPGATEIIVSRWSDYNGVIKETSMPALDALRKQAVKLSLAEIRTRLGIQADTQLVHFAVPAFYTQEVVDVVEEALQYLPDVSVLARIHPKASADEQTYFQSFIERNTNCITSASTLSPTEAILVSNTTISVIASTMLIQAALLDRAAIGISSPSALAELAELGDFKSAGEFPYVKNGFAQAAADSDALRDQLQKNIVDTFDRTRLDIETNATSAIIAQVAKHL